MTDQVLRGFRAKSEDNFVCGEFMIYNIPAAPRGVHSVQLTFALDTNRVLTVSVCAPSVDKSNLDYQHRFELKNHSVDELRSLMEASRLQHIIDGDAKYRQEHENDPDPSSMLERQANVIVSAFVPHELASLVVVYLSPGFHWPELSLF